jgi:pilus assembly protein CpaB
MNSTFLRVLATLMVIAAIVTAYLGYRISQKKPADTIAVVIPTYSHVIAHQDIAAGQVLTMDDLETASTQQADKQHFSDPQQLVGKITLMAVAKGTPLNSSHFPVSGLLGQALAPHERAVAIKVNEVIGVGGFIKPGDHVDVLLYLRPDRETGDVSSAQVLLSNVKVLAYGELINEQESAFKDEPSPSTPGKLASNNRSNHKESRSATLAVNEHDLSKLMLAESTGVLRLALRGEAAMSATSDATATITNNQFIKLDEVARHAGGAPSTLSGTAASYQVTAKPPSNSSRFKQERVIVHQGPEVTVINVAK